MKTNENKLQSRDFISIGVFTLIYAAVTFVVGGVSQMTPGGQAGGRPVRGGPDKDT